MVRLLVTMVCIFAFAGCIKQDYMGETYAPTQNVLVFYDESEIDMSEYHVMGSDTATASGRTDSQKIVEEMRMKAREVGADAMVVTGVEKYASGNTSGGYYTEHGDHDDSRGLTTNTSTTRMEKAVTAKFLKRR